MTQQKISDIRKRELINATMKSIYRHGFADLTVAQIAKDAQVSTGNIHYYFGGKDALLEATMRHLLSLLSEAHLELLKNASDPTGRLNAVVQANFDPKFLTPETCRIWTQFWAFAPYRPRLSRLHRINRARVKSNIVAALKNIVPESELRVMTNAIQGYMDGVWIQVAQSDDRLDLARLQTEASQFIDQTIGR